MHEEPFISTKLCRQCDLDFLCGPVKQSGQCWCNAFPPILSPDPENDCLCPGCLQKLMEQKIKVYSESVTIEQANKLDLNKYKTAKNIVDIDYYIENGFFVFSKWYHLKRGTCCENGCRHCPYGFKGI